MKCFDLILILLLWAQTNILSAQIFEFGWPYSGQQRRSQAVEEPITKPEYKGGNEALNKYLRANFKNPVPTDNVDGRIIVALVISEKGKVVEAAVVSGLTKPLNEEALRVAKKLKFRPAKRGKKKIKSRFDVGFPIRRGRLSFNTLNTIEV